MPLDLKTVLVSAHDQSLVQEAEAVEKSHPSRDPQILETRHRRRHAITPVDMISILHQRSQVLELERLAREAEENEKPSPETTAISKQKAVVSHWGNETKTSMRLRRARYDEQERLKKKREEERLRDEMMAKERSRWRARQSEEGSFAVRLASDEGLWNPGRRWKFQPSTRASRVMSATRRKVAADARPPHLTFVHQGGGVYSDNVHPPRAYASRPTTPDHLVRSSSYDSRLLSAMASANPVQQLLMPNSVPSGQNHLQAVSTHRRQQSDTVVLRALFDFAEPLGVPPSWGTSKVPERTRVMRSVGGDLPRPGYKPQRDASRPNTANNLRPSIVPNLYAPTAQALERHEAPKTLLEHVLATAGMETASPLTVRSGSRSPHMSPQSRGAAGQ